MNDAMLRARAAGRSCSIHGDNGCEIRGEAGPRDRAQDKREWQREAEEWNLSDSWEWLRDGEGSP